MVIIPFKKIFIDDDGHRPEMFNFNALDIFSYIFNNIIKTAV